MAWQEHQTDTDMCWKMVSLDCEIWPWHDYHAWWHIARQNWAIGLYASYTAPTQVMKTPTVINQLLSLIIWWMKCNLEPLGQKWLVKKHVTKILKCETPNYRTIVDANILIKSLVIWVQPNIPVTCHTLLESQVRSLRGAVRSAQAHVKALGCRTWQWIRNLINRIWLTLDQWSFQDPKMEVLCHIRPCFVVIFTYIGLI